jgi:hypothetical protein
MLVTNPPFSGEHMKKALEFAASCGRPWALLMPDFVARWVPAGGVHCVFRRWRERQRGGLVRIGGSA